MNTRSAGLAHEAGDVDIPSVPGLTVAFLDGAGSQQDLLRHQILSAVQNALLPQTRWVDVPRDAQRSADTLDVSLFPNVAGDVLLMFDLADRNHFRQFAPDRHPYVKDFRHVVVPGHWLRRRLLADEQLKLGEANVLALGAPRVDLLRALAAARPPKPDDAPLNVLFVTVNESWRDRDGAPMSVRAAMKASLPILATRVELVEIVDGRNRVQKVPITQELLDADVVITDYTSLMYEAWALGKPVIFPHWLCAERILQKAPHCAEAHVYRERIGHHPDGLAALCALLDQGRSLDLGAGVEDFMADYLANWAGPPAGPQIARLLEDLLDPERELRNQEARDALQRALTAKDWPAVELQATGLLLWNPDEAGLHDALARAYNGLGKWWLEANALEVVRAARPADADLHYRLAVVAQRMGRHVRAAAAYAEAIRLAPENATADWHYRLGYVLETPGHDGPPDPRAAAAAYAVASAMDERAGRFGVGAFHAAAGRWKEAALAYEKRLRTQVLDADLHYRLGLAHDRCYEWAEAEACYYNALAIKPNTPSWLYRLGFVLERQEKFTEAGEIYLLAAEKSKTHNPTLFYRAGYVLEKAGRLEEACAAYGRFDAKYTRPAQSARWTERFAQGKLRLTNEQVQLAKQQIDLAPRNARLWMEYSKLLEAAGDLEAAVKAANQAIILSPQSEPEYATHLGHLEDVRRERVTLESRLGYDCTRPNDWLRYSEVLEGLGDLEQAVEAMQQAVMRSEEYVPAWYHRLGVLLQRCGRFESACAAFRCQQILQRPHGTYEDKFQNNASIRDISTYREFYDVLDIDSQTVLYESYSGVSVSCNPLAMYRKISADPAYDGWKHFWVTDSLDLVPEDMRRQKNVFFCKRGGSLYMRLLASVEYLINNSTFPSYFTRKDGQKYLNTWHGTPLKALGADIVNPPLARANTARNFLQATHMIFPNAHTRWVLVDRYEISHLLTAREALTGYPRIDGMLGATEATKATIRNRLGLDGRKPVVLYAPTFRGSMDAPEIEDAGLIDALSVLGGDSYDCIFRGHYFAEKTVAQMDLPIKVAPADIDTCALLSIVDILVTDYSSIYFDFLPSRRPVIHLATDWDEYKRARGAYFELDELPGRVCVSPHEAREAIEQAIGDPAAFLTPEYLAAIDTFCPKEDGQSTDRAVKFLFSEAPSVKKDRACNVLFYAGGLEKNGITGAGTSLLRLMPEEGLAATVLVNNGTIKEANGSLDRLKKIGAFANTLVRTGAVPWSLEERWLNDKLNGLHYFGPAMLETWRAGVRMDVRRTIGEASIDVAIDFDGYSPYMTNFQSCVQAEKHILFMHNDIGEEWRSKYPHLKRAFQSHPLYSSIATVSQEVATRNLATFGDAVPDAKRRFTVIRNTIPCDEIEALAKEDLADDRDFTAFKADTAFRIINLGRLSPEKNQRRLIDAIEILNGKGLNVSAYILGRGPLLTELTRYRDSKGLRNVHLLGLKENPFPYMAAADALVLSSDYEGQPLVLMEAMLLGTPCVATRIPGPDGMLDQGRGVLTDPDPAALAEGLARVCRDEFVPPEFDCRKYNKEAMADFLAAIGRKTGEPAGRAKSRK